MADEVDLLGRALDQAHQVLLGAADADPGAPTPCRSWDLAQLRDHVVSDLDRFLVAARGERPDWSAPEPEQHGDRAAAFRTGADAVLAAWRAADRSTPVQSAMGEVPASFVISQQLSDGRPRLGPGPGDRAAGRLGRRGGPCRARLGTADPAATVP